MSYRHSRETAAASSARWYGRIGRKASIFTLASIDFQFRARFRHRRRPDAEIIFISFRTPLRNHFADSSSPTPRLTPQQPPASPISAISLPFAARGASGADYTASRRSVSHELRIEQVNESFPRQFRVIIESRSPRLSGELARTRRDHACARVTCRERPANAREAAGKLQINSQKCNAIIE